MTQDQIIALVGFSGVAIGALLSGLITFFIAGKRNNLEARIEICKYREKWLEQLRNEVVLLSSLDMAKIKSPLTADDKREFFKHLSTVNLLVNSTNSHWPDLQKSMAGLVQNFGTNNCRELPNFEQTAKKILKEEWDEIQALLYKKKKKKTNAKNK